MPKGDYAAAVRGVRFLRQRELPPVSTCLDFQTTEEFPIDSARNLLEELPEDWQISFIDPEAQIEEAWIFVRRVGQRFFAQKMSRASSRLCGEQSLEKMLTSFAASPLVRKPAGSFASFTVSSIPDHQRFERLDSRLRSSKS